MTGPPRVRVVPAAGAIDWNPTLPRTTARVLLNVAVDCKTPVLSVSAPDVSPRLPSVLTLSVPPATVQGVTAPVVPVSVQVLAPVFSNAPKPRYWAAGPIADTSKLALVPPPPSARVSVVEATTLP